MTTLALIIAIAAAATGHWLIFTAAAIFAALPLAVKVGYRAAVRKSGVSMCKAGSRRIVTGRF